MLKLEELRIVETLLDVVCQRQVLVILLAYCLIVYLHVVVYSLFVAQVVIIFHFAILYKVMRGHVLLFLFFLVFGFLSSTDNFAVFCCAVVRCR